MELAEAGLGRRHAAAAFALAFCATWNAGNVGPIASQLSADFDVGLSTVGLISGTFFFAGIVIASLAGAERARRIPVGRGLRASCWLLFAGNVLCLATPVLGGLVAGRVVAGLGMGVVLLFGGGYARAAGGLRLLGIYGAGVTLGVACALAAGGLLEGDGASWRVSFAVSAGLALIPLLLLPREVPGAPPAAEPREGLMRESLSRPAFWRLSLLTTSALGVPMVIGAWLVPDLVFDEGMSVGAAGIVSFGLFAVSTVARYGGGVLPERGVPEPAVIAAGCSVGAAGIAALAVGEGTGWALLAAFLMGAGLSLPAAIVYDVGERVLPDRPLGGLGLQLVGANAFPIAAIPLIGAALGAGDRELAWLLLAGFVLAAGVANLSPSSARRR